MSPAETYRRYAAECVALAQKASTPEDRAHLLQMAQHWRQLAEKAEAQGQATGQHFLMDKRGSGERT
jgi:hypothetical protein